MLKRLAVAGDDLDPVSVVALTGLPEPEAFALLDLALGAGALVVSGAGYRFRHELVRQALLEAVPPHRRIAIHRDAARGLAAAGGQPARVARHWLDGGRPDEAVDWLLAAARQAVGLGAFVDALGHLDSLLEHAPQHAVASLSACRGPGRARGHQGQRRLRHRGADRSASLKRRRSGRDRRWLSSGPAIPPGRSRR